MRTTLDLDDDVLRAARALATAQRKPMGKIVSALVRQSLQRSAARLKQRDGVPVLARRAGHKVTDSLINRIRENEGI